MADLISGESLMENSAVALSRPICLVGEHFYIQLFIDFNLFGCARLYVYNTDKDFWSCDVEICYLSKEDLQKEAYYIIYCGFNLKENGSRFTNVNCDFFDIASVYSNGTFEYKGKKYVRIKDNDHNYR